MQQATQIALIRRALAHIAAGATDRGEPATSPVQRYLSEERLASEKAVLFRSLPQVLGPASKVAQAGDFFTHERTGVPLLVVRGGDGVLRGFVNACRHRRARVELAAAGTGKRVIVCPYHSWTYELDGRLKGLPHAHEFPHVDVASTALIPVPVAERLGLVWCIPEPGAELNLEAYLGGIEHDLAAWGYDKYVAWSERSFESASNWKLTFDANLETYHFHYAHKSIIAPRFYDNLAIVDHFGDHVRMVLPTRDIEALAAKDPQTWRIGDVSHIVYFFFPNTMFLFQGDHATLFTVFPMAPGRSAIQGITLIPEPPAGDKAKAHWDKNVRLFWEVLGEDFALMESVQSTLASGADAHLNFGKSEYCAGLWHAAIERRLAAA